MNDVIFPFRKKTTIKDIEQALGKQHYKTIKDFFETAFELIDFAINGADVFVVFIARRCFVLACIFLRALIPKIGNDKYKKRLSKVYSDGGLRILAKQLAREFFIDDEYQCKIFLFDDILIHGRAVGGLLSSAEDIFAKEYKTLKKHNPGMGKTYTNNQLYDKFLQFIIIKTGYISTQPDLLRERYKARLDRDDFNLVNPRKWRDVSNRISNIIYNSETPNAAFVPGLLFSQDFLNKDIIRESFSSAKIKHHRSEIRNWEYLQNEYKGRKADVYIMTTPYYGDVHTVFSIRCTDRYLMPLVFLPKFTEDSKAWSLADEIIDQLIDIGYPHVLDLYRLIHSFQRVEKLSNMYTELITMIYSVALMRAFLTEINCDISEYKTFDSEYYLNNFTTKSVIMGNYAHETVIEDVLSYLLDPRTKPLFSLREIKEKITNHRKKGDYIIEYFYNYSDISLNQEEEERLVNNLEKAIFKFGIDSEIEAYRLSTGVFVPSYESVEYFYFPRNNDLKRVISSIYQVDYDWMRDHASFQVVFSYVLQMMDYGSLSLITGTIDQNVYMQCLKAGEQSLNVEAAKFALALPIMYEIELRCQRQGRMYTTAFSDELDYFNHQARFYILDNQNPLLQKACNLLRDEKTADEIKDFEKGLSRAGHKCNDYMFALEEKLGEYGDKEIAQFEQECREFYYHVVY